MLSVPGTASLRGSVTNESAATASLRVSPIYAAPFSDSDLFTLMVCRLKAKNGACMAPPSFSVTYDAASGATNFFKVFVQAPANDPGFDPEARRIFLNVWQNKPDSRLPGTGSVEVATDSIAPRKD